MADNKKVIISVVINDAGAKTKLKGISDETENLGNGANKASKGFLGLGKTFTAIARGFVIVKSFQLLSKAITESVKILADFELSMAKVKAITGATDQEFKKLEKSAQELALGTIFTATQVAELQLAYAKLGFTTEEILNATEATTKLATITGDDLANSADVVGATIRGFGLDAQEATRVVDIMAQSFSSSALSLENFKQSMKTVAPIASSANISLEQTTAMLGVLADAGIRGTKAATGLKNLMSQLTDPTSDLAKELGYTVNNSEGLNIAFEELVKRNIDLAKATGLTDERSKAAFLTLLKGKDSVDKLRESLEESTGVSDKMADTVGNTLSGSWDRFKSSVEGFTLREGEGLSKILSTALNKMSEFLNETDRGYRIMKKFEGAQKEIGQTQSTQNTSTEKLKELLKASGELYDQQEAKLKKTRDLYREQNKELSDFEIVLGFITGELGETTEERKEEFKKIKEQLEGYRSLNDEQKSELILRQARLKDSRTFQQEVTNEINRLKSERKTVNSLGEEYVDLTNEIEKWQKLLKDGDPTSQLLKQQEDLAKERKKQFDDEQFFYKWRKEANKDNLENLILITKNELKWLEQTDEFKKKSLNEQILIREKFLNTIDNLSEKFAEQEIDRWERILKPIEDVNKEIGEIQKINLNAGSSDLGEVKGFLGVILGVKEKDLEKFEERLQTAVELTQAFSDTIGLIADVRLQRVEYENQIALDNLTQRLATEARMFEINHNDQLESFIGTEQQKADFAKQKALEKLEFEQKQQDEIDKMRKQQLVEENRLAKQAFFADKANNIARAIQGTALGVINALTVLPPAGIALAALIGATGTAQVATIASQKFLPKTFQDGGIVNGALHRDGGVPFTVKGQGGFEMEGGEYIMSRKAVNKVGVDFLDRINFDGKAPDNSYMFANGGVVPRVQNNAINQAELADMIGEAIAMRISQIPVINVATDTSSISRKVFNAQSMATF